MKLQNPPSLDDVGIDRYRFCGLDDATLTVKFWKFGTAARGEPPALLATYTFADKRDYSDYLGKILD